MNTSTLSKGINLAIADRVNTVQEYYFAKKLREIDEMNQAGKEVINLGIGSPDLPPHPEVIETLYKESLNPRQHGYQNYKGHPLLRAAAAHWYQVYYHVSLDPATEILPLIGSKEGIMHICMTYINPGDEVLIPDPGYPTYRSAATIAGATVKTYSLTEENNWYPDLKALERADLSRVTLMFVNYPHMPTGKAATIALFEQLVSFAQKHQILIVNDNPYSFILNDNPISALVADGARDVIIELNSLSKSHNMAGWRIGFMMAAANRIEEVMRFKSNMDSGMFLPLQLAAAKALSLPKAWYAEVNRSYSNRRTLVYRLLDLLGARYNRDQSGLFIWAKVSGEYKDGYALSDEVLHKANVFITPGGIFGKAGDEYIRISLCAKEEVINEAINRMESARINKK